MRETLEVGLVPYLHPRQRHCTDEAQKAEIVLSAVSYIDRYMDGYTHQHINIYIYIHCICLKTNIEKRCIVHIGGKKKAQKKYR